MDINEVSGYNFIGLASSISILISKGLSPTELAILSGFFSAIGDNLAILSAIPQNSQNDSSPNTYN